MSMWLALVLQTLTTIMSPYQNWKPMNKLSIGTTMQPFQAATALGSLASSSISSGRFSPTTLGVHTCLEI